MTPTVHKIKRYSVQVLSKRTGNDKRVSVIVRLYNEEDKTCGLAVFKDYGDEVAERPVGDYPARSATVYYDIDFYQPFIEMLRHEAELFWKIAWVQMGPNRTAADVSLDTKKEIIGEFFQRM